MLDPVIADQIDDASAALGFHVRYDGAGAAHVTEEFKLQRRLPGFVRQRLQNAASSGSGIVDENIDPSEFLRGTLDKFVGLFGLCQIGGDGNDLPAGLVSNLLRRRFQRFRAACADGDIDAFLRKRPGNRFAYSGAAAGHRRAFAD